MTLLGFALVGLGGCSMRKGHLEIVNGEKTTVSFYLRCGKDSLGQQTLQPREKAEYSCGRDMEATIKTIIKGETQKEVKKTLKMESRNILFWDEEQRCYDIRKVE